MSVKRAWKGGRLQMLKINCVLENKEGRAERCRIQLRPKRSQPWKGFPSEKGRADEIKPESQWFWTSAQHPVTRGALKILMPRRTPNDTNWNLWHTDIFRALQTIIRCSPSEKRCPSAELVRGEQWGSPNPTASVFSYRWEANCGPDGMSSRNPPLSPAFAGWKQELEVIKQNGPSKMEQK